MNSPENPKSPHLENCLTLLSSLSHSIPTVQSFITRWSALSPTLARLHSSLDQFSALPRNEISDELLLLLSQTLTLTLSISNQCQFSDPPRLQTQSDLAAAASSLHQHAADTEFLLRSFPLLNQSSSPSSRRAEARSLITRLQIGTAASRIPPLNSLISILNRDEKTVLIVSQQGLVPALVQLLDSASPEMKEKAVSAIARVSTLESCRHLLFSEAEFLLIHLSRVISEPDGIGSTKEKACVVLQALTLQKDIALTVGSGGNGTVSFLLEICRFGTPSAQGAAAGVLKNLTAVNELREKLVDENVVSVLISVLRSGTNLARENSAYCLSNLTAGEDKQSIKLAVLQQGVLDCIRNFWEVPFVEKWDLEPAIRLVRNLCSSIVFSEIVLSLGFLPRIIIAMDSTSVGTRTEAVRAIGELAHICTNKDGLEQSLPKIVRMLEAKGTEEKEEGVKALASLMSFPICRRFMRKDEKGIVNLIKLLDSSNCNVEKKNVVTVLLAVAQSRRCRKLMVASGALGLLPGIERMEVEGAKKLSQLLSKGRILGVFPRN